MQGLLRWEKWLPDGTHPTERGSISYAKPVITYLENEFSEPRDADAGASVVPVHDDNLENARPIPFDSIMEISLVAKN